MLDFGTDMDSREELETSDDLFAAGDYENKSENAAGETLTAKVERKTPERKTPERPLLKPPTLPKYHESPVTSAAEQKKNPVKGTITHLHRKKKSENDSIEDKMEVSRLLKEARHAAGLSVDDVENSTQIRARYITALEEADYDKLPQQVYVLAYLRKLCSLYAIPEEKEEILIQPWRNIQYELPENLPAAIQMDEENENGDILDRLKLVLFAVGAVIVLGIVLAIIVLIVSYFSGKDVPETRFDNTRLLEIQEKPKLITPKK
jgi:hypothetical protein